MTAVGKTGTNGRKIGKRFLTFISLSSSTIALTPPHDSSSNSPRTQWVAMVSPAVTMVTMTSYFVQKPWPGDFDPLIPLSLCATVSTLSHDSASNCPRTQWVAMLAAA